MAHYEKSRKKGHGCCGSIFTFILVLLVAFLLLLFCTDTLSGIKMKVMEHFYPRDYSEYVSQYSEEYSVDETLIYAVIRTESGFHADAQSGVGAMGLMQIMPETYDYMLMLEGDDSDHDDNELLNPQINIKYGTYYMSILLEHYGGKEQLAIAAYNGGIANVDSWLTDSRYSQDGITLSEIPYNETAQYVERVESAKEMYESLYYDNN